MLDRLLFRFKNIPDLGPIDLPSGKVYDLGRVEIGPLPWNGSKWQRVYQPDEDKPFNFNFPWDKDNFLRENLVQSIRGIDIIGRMDGTKAVLFSNFKVKYGKFSVFAKLPNVSGYWSAFWLFNDMPELDVFEHCGGWKHSVAVTHHHGLNYTDKEHYQTRYNKRTNRNFRPTRQYYWYSVEVTPREVIYSINNVITRVVKDSIPSHDSHIILNNGFDFKSDYCNAPKKPITDSALRVKYLVVNEYF